MIHLQDLQEKVIYVLLDGTLKEKEYVMMKLTWYSDTALIQNS